MKRYLLSLLIIPFLFLGFSNSQFTSTENITQEYTKSYYENLYLTEGITYTIVNLNGGPLRYQPCVNSSSDVRLNISVGSSYVIKSSDVSPKLQCYGEGVCNFSVSYINKREIVPVSSLTPAINGLMSAVYQIIPFVIYIGIGVLIVTLGFFAIRWLVNWIWGKINSYFISKRG